MTIRYAILGLLRQHPQTGYDLKKTISTSAIFHWSGNNNQVYTTLLQLHAEGLVEVNLVEADGYPGKKIYHITARGKEVMQAWLISSPSLPETKNHFLVQFVFADSLSSAELSRLLDLYESEVQHALLLQREQIQREAGASGRTSRQAQFYQLAANSGLMAYEAELNWITQTRKILDGGIV